MPVILPPGRFRALDVCCCATCNILHKYRCVYVAHRPLDTMIDSVMIIATTNAQTSSAIEAAALAYVSTVDVAWRSPSSDERVWS